MLSDREREVIKLVLQGSLTKDEICKEVGYSNRSSIYKILEKEDAKEYMEKLADRAVGEAVSILKANANEAAKNLIRIASGDIKDADKQTVYAILNAINSVLEKSGLNSKNIVLEDKRNNKETKVSDEDIDAEFKEIEKELEEDEE